MRALLAIENLGEEPLNTTLRDAWCDPVELVIMQRVGKNNPVTPTDDDRAMALATLIEYLSGDYDVGIVIARDRRVEILIEHYIKQLREGRDFCHVIRDSKNEPRYSIELSMPKWAIERVNEGGDVKIARIGLKDGEPYLALTAEREVEPYQPSEYKLVVDVNSWRHGIAWGLAKNGKLITWRTEKPGTFLLNTLYYQAMDRERKVGELKRLGYSDSARV